jgi:hypothetical protein
MRARVRGVATGLVVLCAVAACSPNGGGAEASDVAARAAHLEDILAGVAPDRDADQFELDLAGRKENLIATCMAGHQMTYQPRDPHSVVDTVTNTDFASKDYAAQYGFGIATFPTFSGTDGNAQYLKSLSEDQRREYQKCDETANTQAQDEYGVKQANDRFTQRDDAVRADSRYTAAQAQWATCAAAKGYQQPNREALIDSLRTDHDKILQRLTAKTGDAPDPDRAVRELAGADQEFQAFQARERQAAVDTFPCSQDLDRVYAEVYRSHRS